MSAFGCQLYQTTYSMRQDKLCPPLLSKSSFARSNSSVGTQKGFFRQCPGPWDLRGVEWMQYCRKRLGVSCNPGESNDDCEKRVQEERERHRHPPHARRPTCGPLGTTCRPTCMGWIPSNFSAMVDTRPTLYRYEQGDV